MAALLVLTAKGANGTVGPLTSTPTSASFGSVPVGTANTYTLKLKNAGTSSLTISSATISGSGFSMTSFGTPHTLTAGASINLNVTFRPASTGSVGGKVTLTSNATDSTLTINLSGLGVAATRTLSFSSSSIYFGDESLSSSSTAGLTIENTGNSAVTISGVTVNGTAFSVSGGLAGASLSAGQSATLVLQFAPHAAGNLSGQLVITSNASNSPGTVPLSGTGVNSTHFAALKWTASTSPGITGYYVYRATTSTGTYSKLNPTPTATTQFTDGSVTAGHTYYYVVTSVSSSAGESAHSNQISTLIP